MRPHSLCSARVSSLGHTLLELNAQANFLKERSLKGMLFFFSMSACAFSGRPSTLPASRTITDAIHHNIELHPLAVLVVDTPEFQRLRQVSQVGSCRWVFPSAVHDRFQHSLGVAHLARQWAQHIQSVQPALQVTDAASRRIWVACAVRLRTPSMSRKMTDVADVICSTRNPGAVPDVARLIIYGK